MHAGTERKTPERFMDRNGTDRNGNGHISTPLASQKPMTSAIFMSRRDLQLLFFFEQSKKSLQGFIIGVGWGGGRPGEFHTKN